VLLSQRSKRRIDEKIRELTPRTWGQSLRDCIRGLNEYLLGWIGFFRIATVRALSTLDAHIRRRLRAIAIRHWRKRRSSASWKPLKPGRRSWWCLSNSPPVTRVLTNARFAERGLLSLEATWVRYQTPPEPVIAPAQLELALG
jgi:hypothetical protein